MHVGLWVEAEHVRSPQLLLALRSPTLLPCPMAALRSDVRVVLRADGTVLPTIPLADTRPRRHARVRSQHALAHHALHGVPAKLDEPAKFDRNQEDADEAPWRHVHLRKGVVAEGVIFAIGALLCELLLRLWGRNQVHDVLEGGREPSGGLARAALVEEAASGLLRLVVRPLVGRLGDRVKPEGQEDVHDDDARRNATSNVDHGLGVGVGVHQAQGDGGHEGAANLPWKGAAMLGQDVQAEDNPHTSCQASGAQIRAPHHAQLCDVVQGDPVGEGHDQMHHAIQEAHTHVGLATPPLLLRRAQQLEVLERLRRPIHAATARRRLGLLLALLQLLDVPRRRSRGEAGHAALDLLDLRLYFRGNSRNAALLVPCAIVASLLLALLGRLAAWRHHEGDAEHVVDVLLLPRGENLPGCVKLLLPGHRQTHAPGAELDASDLRAERGVEEEVHREHREAHADDEALQVDARDEDRRPGKLEARAALHEHSDAHGGDDAVDRAVHLQFRHRDACEVRDVLPKHADLRASHLSACGETLPPEALVELVVGAVVVPSEDAEVFRDRRPHGDGRHRDQPRPGARAAPEPW
mmetsp:Transcript_24932/g.71550  ORF Transcript_24932/g.71550 Transcript_24932/m.71550 type:complete len:581 (-) Transcript_24932:66-1808(-)